MENSLLFNEDTEFSVLLPFLADKKLGSAAIDRLFAKQIIRNHYPAESYFLGDYSRPILNQLAVNVLGFPEDYVYGEPAEIILGEYYEFISKPFDGKKKGWRNLQLYKGVNKNGKETRLHSYVHFITRNHFLKIALKEKKQYGMSFFDIITEEQKASGLDIDTWDKHDYEIVLNCDIEEIESKNIPKNFYSDSNDEYSQRLRKQKIALEAYLSLPESDRIILQCLVVEKIHWKDAYDELRRFMNPNGPNNEWRHWTFEEKQKAMDKYWTPKQKQDALHGIKERTIEHLAIIYNRIIKEGKYDKEENLV